MLNATKLRLVAIALILLINSFSVFAQAEEAAIRKVMDDQSAAWNRGDIDGFMAGYWKSEKLTFVSGTDVTRGWQPTLDRYKKGYKSDGRKGSN